MNSNNSNTNSNRIKITMFTVNKLINSNLNNFNSNNNSNKLFILNSVTKIIMLYTRIKINLAIIKGTSRNKKINFENSNMMIIIDKQYNIN